MNDYKSFIEYCRKGNISNVKKILDSNPNFINGLKNQDGLYSMTPITISLVNHRIKLSSILLEYGADINYEFILEKTKTFALHTIIDFEIDVFYEQENKYPKKIYINNIEFAVENNALINKYNQKGYTPLDIALKYDHYTGANYLYSKGAKHSIKMFNEFNFQEKQENELKYYSKAYPYLENLKLSDCIETIDSYAYPKELPEYHRELNRIVLEKKMYLIDIPLDLGFLENKFKRGVEPNEKDYLGRTAVDYAIELGHHLAVDYLRSVGGKTSKELEDENK